MKYEIIYDFIEHKYLNKRKNLKDNWYPSV